MRHNRARRRDRRWAVLRRLTAITGAALLLPVVATSAGAVLLDTAASGSETASSTQPVDPTGDSVPATPTPTAEPAESPTDEPSATPGPTLPADPSVPSSAAAPTEAPEEPAVESAEGIAPEVEVLSEDGGFQLFSVPTPPSGSAVISVRVGGDRIAGTPIQASGLEGVTLRLQSSATGGTVYGTCVSDAQGDCSFIVRIGSGGMSSSQQPWVVQVGAPTGWRLNDQIRIGSGSGSDNVALPYRFRIEQSISANNRYVTVPTSGATTLNPMVGEWDDDDYSDSDMAPSGYWATSRVNPDQPQQCGVNYAVLVDLSSSISASELAQAKTAVNTFIDGLRGTPSQVALFNFDRTSPVSSGYANQPALRPVRTAAEAAIVKGLYAGWDTGSGTNWDAGLYAVATAAPTYDVVVVLTDGNPTQYGTSTPDRTSSSPNRVRDDEAGIFSANLLKAKGSTVVAMGVGMSTPASITSLNLQAISGPIQNSDYYMPADYALAAADLAALAKGNCEGSIDVIKKVIPASATVPTNPTKSQLDAISTPAAGWQINPVSTGAGVSFGTPAGPWTTNATGHATIPLRFPTPTASGPVSWTETQQAGYVHQPVAGQNTVCINTETNATVTVTSTGTGTSTPGASLPVAVNTAIECTIYNRQLPLPATVTVTKQVTNATGTNPQPAAGWTLGATTTGTTGTVVQAPTATTQITPATGTVSWGLTFSASTARATVAVSETQQSGFLFQSGQCVVTPATGAARTVTLTGVTGSVTGVAPGDSVACTIVNRPAVPALVVSKSANPAKNATVDPGSSISYTLTFANTAGTAPAPVAHTDVLTRVLDDATLQSGPTVNPTGGLTVVQASGNFVITGQVPAGGTVTVTYTMRVNSPATGDGTLANFLVPTGDTPPATCPTASTTCTTHFVAPTLTLVKVVALGSAPTQSWTLTATGPTGARTGPTGQHSATGTPVSAVVTAAQTYALSESGGPATYVQSGNWTCVDTNPTAGSRVGGNSTSVILSAGAAARCTVTNTTSTITLLKRVEGGSAVPSTWNLTATPATFAGLTATTVAGATAAAGANTLEVRPGHSYTLTEAVANPNAPISYRQNRLERLNTDGTWTTVASDQITAPVAGGNATYRFVNVPIAPVTLPLTGGLSTDLFVIVGYGAALLGAVGAGLAWRRRPMA